MQHIMREHGDGKEEDSDFSVKEYEDQAQNHQQVNPEDEIKIIVGNIEFLSLQKFIGINAGAH